MTALDRGWSMFIDGRPVDAEQRYALPEPATEETVALAPDGSVKDIERAVAAARRAFDDGPWPRTPAAERGRALHRMADAIERRKEEIRSVVVRAGGATSLTHGVQIDAPIAHLRHYAELAATFDFEEPLPDGARGAAVVRSIGVRQPAGVCGLIPTWNYPLYVTVQKIGPALAAGCAVVVKPSPFAPLVDLVVAEAAAEADLPPGVFNVVTGSSDALGDALVRSPLVDKVSFTGSVATGKKIAAAAAGTLKRVHLELGGKSAAIVLPDADLDAALPGLAAPVYFHAGQGCALTTRLLVPRGMHDELVARLEAFISRITVGDPADPKVMLGPLIRDERRRAVEALIEAGRAEGATLVTGGRRPPALSRGYFLQPTLFAGVDNRMRVAREEAFGPVLCVIPYDDEEHAVRIANDSPYGLSAAVVTRDTARGRAIARRLRTGGVSVNQANHALVTPFGGFKESGLGREGGRFGLLEYTELQRISWPD